MRSYRIRVGPTPNGLVAFKRGDLATETGTKALWRRNGEDRQGPPEGGRDVTVFLGPAEAFAAHFNNPELNATVLSPPVCCTLP